MFLGGTGVRKIGARKVANWSADREALHRGNEAKGAVMYR